MRLLKRTFGGLLGQLSKGVSPLIQACETLDHSQPQDFSEYPQVISELLKYERTTEAIHKMIQSHIKHTNSPVVLPSSSFPDLVLYLKSSLVSRDMQALDSSIHLFWHSFPTNKFPLIPIANTLLATMPLGTESNQDLWRTLTSQLTFYAIPNQLTPEKLHNFLTLYGMYPENFLLLVKYSIFCLNDKTEEKYGEIFERLNEDLQAYESFDQDEEKGNAHQFKGDSIKMYANKNFMSEEEEKQFRMLVEKMRRELEKDPWLRNKIGTEVDEDNLMKRVMLDLNPEVLAEIQSFEEAFQNKRLEIRKNLSALGKINIDPNPFAERPKILMAELLDLIQTEYLTENVYHISELRKKELLFKCFEYSTPNQAHFEQLEKWLEHQVANNRFIDLPQFTIEVIIFHARRLSRDDFLCFLFNNFDKISTLSMPGELLADLVRIISETECKGSYSDAAGQVVMMADTLLDPEEHPLGLFSFDCVPDNFLKCYLKDKNYKEAKLFAYELTMFGYTFEEKYIEEIAEVMSKEKDGHGILMLKTFYLSFQTRAKLEGYLQEIVTKQEAEGKVYEYFFIPAKYYTQSSKYMKNYLQNHDVFWNLENQRQKQQRKKPVNTSTQEEGAEKGRPEEEELEIEEEIKD